MFASKSMPEHLLRGVIGLTALIAASSLMSASHLWLGLAVLPVALVALRGCPSCWLLGLAQTVIASVRGRSADGYCLDGTCTLKTASTPAMPPRYFQNCSASTRRMAAMCRVDM